MITSCNIPKVCIFHQGLNDSTQAFDIILFTHPSSVLQLPEECSKIEDGFDPTAPGAGKCLYKELVPLSERDFRYGNNLLLKSNKEVYFETSS